MSEKKTPPETPTALSRPDAGHVLNYVEESRAATKIVMVDLEVCTCGRSRLAGVHDDGADRGHAFNPRRESVTPPPDWYDGKPKRCPGSGQPVFVSYRGDCDSNGEKMYRASCKHCGVAFPLGDLPEHTFVPVLVEEFTFKTGKVLEGIEPGGVWDPVPVCDGDHPMPRCLDPQCWRRDPRAGDVKTPRIVVLIGSTHMGEARRLHCEEVLKGHIVLLGFIRAQDPIGMGDGLAAIMVAGSMFSITSVHWEAINELHRHMIDLADEVLVVNPLGHVAPCTAADVGYAMDHSKPIRWLVQP